MPERGCLATLMPALARAVAPATTLATTLATTVAIAPGWSTGRFVARAAAWREAFLAQHGLRWALFIEEPAEFAAALFGAWHAGKTVVLPGDRQPQTLDALRGVADGFAGDLPAGLEAGATPAAMADWGPLRDDHAAVTLFTSGSTGAPTPLPKRLSQLDTEVVALESAFGALVGAGGATITTVSHQHIYGLLFCVLWPLARGTALPAGRLVYHEEIAGAGSEAAAGPAGSDDADVVADGRDGAAGPLVLVSSPAHLRRWPVALDWAGLRGRLRAVFSSGGALPGGAGVQIAESLGRAPVEIYGSSETGGIAWRATGDDGPWTPLPGVAWRIEAGHLAVCSGHLETADWYRGNDRAALASNGSFRLLGRADRIVKIEEKRVSLSALERCLNVSELVDEARVVAMPLEIGVRVAAVVVPSVQGAALLAQGGRLALSRALRAHAEEQVEPIALPRRWAFPAAMPANTQGKTSEAMLLQCLRGTLPAVKWQPAAGTAQPGREAAAAELRIDAGLQVFDGHFAEAPIVPGVAQVDWAIALAEQALPVPPRDRFRRLDILKFQQVIRPGDVVRIDLEWQHGTQTLSFRFTSASGTHASGRAVYEASDV